MKTMLAVQKSAEDDHNIFVVQYIVGPAALPVLSLPLFRGKEEGEL